MPVAQFGQVFALGTAEAGASLNSQEPPLKNVLVEKNQVQASIELSNEQFIEWNEEQVHRKGKSPDDTRPRKSGLMARE